MMTRPISKKYPTIALAALLYVGGATFPALAADSSSEYGGVVFDTVIYGGIGGNWANSQQNGIGIDLGFVTAVNGDIASSGWTISGNTGFSQSNDAASDSNSFSGALLGGYQWHSSDFYFALNLGVTAINNDENPSGGPSDGSEVGAIAQYGFEKKTGTLYLQSYGAASTAFSQIYGHAKVGIRGDTLKYGAEFTTFHDDDSDGTLRFGAFVGDIPLGKASLGLSAGYQHELEAGKDDGIYAQLEFSVPLSIRR